MALIIMISATLNAEARLTLQEIRTASKDVLVAYFTSDTLDLNEVNISNLQDWRINGQACRAIFVHATKANKCAHYIYLQTSDLKEGKKYELTTPYGSRKFRFSSRTTF
ncbi:MAG: hypothetical protein JXN62_13770, partial [Bacteroidales bacterium]|nr:hypothetical protein [Bacteroidales bacterium]